MPWQVEKVFDTTDVKFENFNYWDFQKNVFLSKEMYLSEGHQSKKKKIGKTSSMRSSQNPIQGSSEKIMNDNFEQP